MKKLICSIILVFSYFMTVNAQIADGFYHIQNANTGRYLSISDTDPSNYPVSQSGSVNMAGIRTYLNYDTVAVSPSCVIFVKQLGNGKYDFMAQGSSLYAMTNYKLPVEITPAGNNYIISGTYSGITKELADLDREGEFGYLASNESPMKYWRFIPINTSNEYVGIRPDVKTSTEAYWGTIYAGFNFRLASPGMTAYYVSNAGGKGFSLTEIESDIIPNSTPVVIRCNSANPEENKIEPIIGGYTFNDANWLGGVYCGLTGVPRHFNAVLYNSIEMRILNLNDKGELAFINAKNRPELLINYKDQLYLRANKAFLNVNPGDADVMSLDDYDPEAINTIKTDDKASTGIYTLTGVRIPDGVTPRSGVYIKDGKKVIIK
jgi:hypothetical protein